jgi:hypothetical protein
MVLNGLGLSNRQLYLVPQLFADTPVEHLLGAGNTAADLDDDCLGQTLGWLYAHDVTTLFAGLALRAPGVWAVAVEIGNEAQGNGDRHSYRLLVPDQQVFEVYHDTVSNVRVLDIIQD